MFNPNLHIPEIDISVFDLPDIIAGPIVRRLTPEHITLWLVTSKPWDSSQRMRFILKRRADSVTLVDTFLDKKNRLLFQVGKHAFIQFLDLQLPSALPVEEILEYDIRFQMPEGEQGLADLIPDLLYPNQGSPSLVIKTQLDDILHGSCRKPHHPSRDALLRVDDIIHETIDSAEGRPAILMMTGDQVYCDDVAGPMLNAIQQTIQLLGLYDESWDGAIINNSRELFDSEFCYYRREQLLPHIEENQALFDRFFRGARKPIFTTNSAHNHLITVSEVIALYLLVWSPSLWKLIQPERAGVSPSFQPLYERELTFITDFAKGLSRVRRALAHLPVYMIFDDHDITDDWNLSRGWEESAYSHPFSRRIIGNALIGYWLCQGLGNAPEKFEDIKALATRCFTADGIFEQDKLIDALLDWEQWHYSLPTTPKLVVLDTRTHRWRSESGLTRPSGLMDWESLTELQQDVIHHTAVIMVSPAPVFGVKFIEAVQRIFAFFGHGLMVDAENWMAHPGSANVILNIFRHPKTPQHFIILSGDVHYSFFYRVTLRFRKHSPNISQITASGIKNEFPRRLLRVFDCLNRWLYASRSPLNWFTKRRRMMIRQRKTEQEPAQRLVNQSAIGRVRLEGDGSSVSATLLTATGETIYFR